MNMKVRHIKDGPLFSVRSQKQGDNTKRSSHQQPPVASPGFQTSRSQCCPAESSY